MINTEEENDELLFNEILETEQDFFDDEPEEEDLLDVRVFEENDEEEKKNNTQKMEVIKESKNKQEIKEKRSQELKDKQSNKISSKKEITSKNVKIKEQNIDEEDNNIQLDVKAKKQQDRFKKLRAGLNKEDLKKIDDVIIDEKNDLKEKYIKNNKAEKENAIIYSEEEVEDVIIYNDKKAKNKKVKNKKDKQKKIKYNTEKNDLKETNETSEIVVNKDIDKNSEEDFKIQNDNVNTSKKKNKKEHNIVFRMVRAMLKTIWFIVIVMIILLAIRAVVYKKTDVMGYRVHLILSGSMEPVIGAGDIVVSKPIEGDIEEGDIIAFQEDGMDVIHRVMKVYTRYDGTRLYKTQGDNNNTEDRGLLKDENIIGEYAFKIKNMARFVLFLQNNIVFVFAGVVIVIIFFILIKRVLFK